jgi:rod shape-determining protein MreD
MAGRELDKQWDGSFFSVGNFSGMMKSFSASRRRRRKRARAARAEAGAQRRLRGGARGGARRGPGVVPAVAACALSALLQNSVMQYASVFGVRPNLPLVAAAATGLSLGVMPGGVAGFLLGLYQDALTGKILGMYALIYLYAGIAAGLASQKLRSAAGSLPACLIIVYAMSVAYEMGLYLFAYAIPVLRSGYSFSAGLGYALGRIVVPASFLNAVAFTPYYFLLGLGRKGGEAPDATDAA